MIKNYIRALKAADLIRSKDKEIHAVEFWLSDAEKMTFKITLNDGEYFFIDIYL